MIDQQVTHELKVKPYTELQTQFIILAGQKEIIFADGALRPSYEGLSVSHPFPRDFDDLESIAIFWGNISDILEDMYSEKKGLPPLSTIAVSKIGIDYDRLRKDNFYDWKHQVPIVLQKKELLDKDIFIKQQKKDSQSFIEICFELQLDSKVADMLRTEDKFDSYFNSYTNYSLTSTFVFQAYRLLGVTFQM